MGIIQSSSGDWPVEERYGLVGHSYRVMAKAKNYDEMVVGLMHAFYAASCTVRECYYREWSEGITNGERPWSCSCLLCR